MTDKTLLIPGTGGTQIWKDGQSLGHPVLLNLKLYLFARAGQDVSQTVRDMSMAHDPEHIAPTKTTLAKGSRVSPGPTLEVAYQQLLDRLPGDAPAAKSFPYDWRADLRYNADLLLAHLEEKKPGNGRWKLITHSQGGLVALVASKRYAERHGGAADAFSRLVSHLVMVAPPVYGTVDSAQALIVGDSLGDAVVPEFRKIAGTWPALYQMLPDWRCIKTPEGGDAPVGFFHTQAWARYDFIDPALVTRAWAVRKKYLRDPVTKLAGVKYAFILSKNRRTWDHAVLKTDGRIAFPAPEAQGDGLVPFEITYERMSDTERNRVDAIGKDEHIAEHKMLLTDDAITTLALKRLDA